MTEQRAYKAIFFDLDGTLLPMDTTAFMASYFKALGAYLIRHGHEPAHILKVVGKASKDMMTHDGTKTNENVFWDGFCDYLHVTREKWEPIISPFYTTSFNKLGKDVEPNTAMCNAVHTLKEKGYPLVLSTMPMFPRIAVDYRVSWAGLSTDMFEYVSTFENSHATKPHLAYYQEILEATGFDPKDVLMVGNNTLEDGAITKLGCDLFLITDYLLTVPGGVNLESTKHGTSADFEAFCSSLPHKSQD